MLVLMDFFIDIMCEGVKKNILPLKFSCKILQSNFIEMALQHVCSPVNLLHFFRTPFFKNTSEGLLLENKLICAHILDFPNTRRIAKIFRFTAFRNKIKGSKFKPSETSKSNKNRSIKYATRYVLMTSLLVSIEGTIFIPIRFCFSVQMMPPYQSIANIL